MSVLGSAYGPSQRRPSVTLQRNDSIESSKLGTHHSDHLTRFIFKMSVSVVSSSYGAPRRHPSISMEINNPTESSKISAYYFNNS